MGTGLWFSTAMLFYRRVISDSFHKIEKNCVQEDGFIRCLGQTCFKGRDWTKGSRGTIMARLGTSLNCWNKLLKCRQVIHNTSPQKCPSVFHVRETETLTWILKSEDVWSIFSGPKNNQRRRATHASLQISMTNTFHGFLSQMARLAIHALRYP